MAPCFGDLKQNEKLSEINQPFKDAAEEAEEEAKNKKPDSSPKKAPKVKKTFFPPDHLFKYELQEIEPDNPEDNPVSKIYCSEKIKFFILNFAHLCGFCHK